MKKIPALISVLLVTTSFGAESKILSKAAKYLPNLTEIGYVTNIVNLWYQMGQFVRSTNHIVQSIENAKEQWEYTGELLDKLYTDVTALKNLDIYDMDSWAQTLDAGNNLILYNVRDLRNSFNMTEFYSVDATANYIKELSDAASYDIRNKANRETVNKYFLSNEYQSNLEIFRLTQAGYQRNTLQLLRSRLQEERAQNALMTDPAEIAMSNQRIVNLNSQIEKLESVILEAPGTNKLDSVLEISSQMIASNLTEIQYSIQRIKALEKAAGLLRESFTRIKSGELDVQLKQDLKNVSSVAFDVSKFSATDADKVPVPKAPENLTAKASRTKEVSDQDVAALQNQIEFILLVQESLYRDINIMKTNTMSFIVALEAFKQDKKEQVGFFAAHNAKMMQLALKDLK